jgi:surface protein
MYEMFRGARIFNQPLENWDVSSVTNMRGMFNDTQAFDQDLSSWGSQVDEFIGKNYFSGGTCPLKTSHHPWPSWADAGDPP